MSSKAARRPVVLCVLDGWGWRPEESENAIALADTPVFDRLMDDCPTAFLQTSGTDVGLPDGQMGNSEVGHLNLGAGRIVNQDIQRITAAINDGSLVQSPVLGDLITKLTDSNGTCHLMGLVSPGGVHSHQDQVVALAKILNDAGIKVAIHAFLDGRDTPPKSAADFMQQFCDDIAPLALVSVVTVTGRFYAMDRDKRWDRVSQAYKAIVSADGEGAENPMAAIAQSYSNDVTDEFVLPAVIGDYGGMQDGDAVLMGNFRADRAREILTSLLDAEFDGFERADMVALCDASGLVEYSETLSEWMTSIFPPEILDRIFAEVIADAGMKQFRIAETEKYAHVTFFFNGGVETPYPGEDRALIPSPKVATYDEKPEMSAVEVTDRLIEAIGSGNYDFIFVNYANPDMVGHTGILPAAIKAIATVDQCLGRLETAIKNADGALLITADHGNAETMTDPDTGKPFTSHTTNVVPAILVNAPSKYKTLSGGALADVAPTLMTLMALEQPPQMTGHSLVETTGVTDGGGGINPVSASA
ncbi:MAG: 2,3-bisphosphoglycerate-independent phosphoglycerate mutase [Alphaproteobacteria bacterium]|nr:2,3-bisphosphoglycerate-independent phosphoglycerate mutase [Alphaproteobacteria bacterium]